MPRTAQELGFEDIGPLDTNIHAGIRYMSLLLSRTDPRIPLKHRIRFALAAYNVGEGHVKNARRLATRMSWDADRWFGQTKNRCFSWSSRAITARRGLDTFGARRWSRTCPGYSSPTIAT